MKYLMILLLAAGTTWGQSTTVKSSLKLVVTPAAEILRCEVIETDPLIRLACRNDEGEFVFNVSITSEFERALDALDADSLQAGVSLVYLERKPGQLCLHDVEAQGEVAGARHSAINTEGECFKFNPPKRKRR